MGILRALLGFCAKNLKERRRGIVNAVKRRERERALARSSGITNGKNGQQSSRERHELAAGF
jgi:hypothetical protein